VARANSPNLNETEIFCPLGGLISSLFLGLHSGGKRGEEHSKGSNAVAWTMVWGEKNAKKAIIGVDGRRRPVTSCAQCEERAFKPLSEFTKMEAETGGTWGGISAGGVR